MTIKVLHVVPHMQIGGINRFVLDLVYYLCQDSNIETGIYICSDANPAWRDKAEALGVPLYWDRLGAMDLNPMHYRQFRRVAKDYDIVHWHVYNPIQTLGTYFDRKKHVFTYHSVLGTGRVSKKTDAVKWWLFKLWCNNRLDCGVYNSEYTRAFWKGYGLWVKKDTVVYNGARFAQPDIVSDSQELSGLKGRFVIGTACNFIGWKRVDLLMKAFALFVKKKDAVLLLVGDGSERKKLESLASELGIGDNVVFTGFQQNVLPYQKAMDVCVFPSTTETFGLSALECMHLGKPVLCMRDGGGICEVIENQDDIVDDVQSLANRLEYYYIHTDERLRQGKANIQRAETFLMQDKAKEYAKLYAEVLRRCGV